MVSTASGSTAHHAVGHQRSGCTSRPSSSDSHSPTPGRLDHRYSASTPGSEHCLARDGAPRRRSGQVAAGIDRFKTVNDFSAPGRKRTAGPRSLADRVVTREDSTVGAARWRRVRGHVDGQAMVVAGNRSGRSAACRAAQPFHLAPGCRRSRRSVQHRHLDSDHCGPARERLNERRTSRFAGQGLRPATSSASSTKSCEPSPTARLIGNFDAQGEWPRTDWSRSSSRSSTCRGRPRSTQRRPGADQGRRPADLPADFIGCRGRPG